MLSTWLFTKFKGKCIGTDSFGNKYFIERPLLAKHLRKTARRWVIYQGMSEASKVPAAWHGWLHGTTDEVPKVEVQPHPWEKSHLPNLTGTVHAYQPNPQDSASVNNLPYYQSWESSKLRDDSSES
ncbi:MAG: NADH-ubiquinone oxidoreductase subunit NDUFA12 family protein [Pseudomonadota bacterium]